MTKYQQDSTQYNGVDESGYVNEEITNSFHKIFSGNQLSLLIRDEVEIENNQIDPTKLVNSSSDLQDDIVQFARDSAFFNK